MLRIDRERSPYVQNNPDIADAVVGVFSPFVLSQRFGRQSTTFVPGNVTLKELWRITGQSPNTIKNALQHTVKVGRDRAVRAGLPFTDTFGTQWLIRVGPPGKNRPKQAARIAGGIINGAEKRIRRSTSKYNEVVTTPVILEKYKS